MFGGCFGAFSFEKKRDIHPKIQIGIWELRGQNPHCKDLLLTIQMSVGNHFATDDRK